MEHAFWTFSGLNFQLCFGKGSKATRLVISGLWCENYREIYERVEFSMIANQLIQSFGTKLAACFVHIWKVFKNKSIQPYTQDYVKQGCPYARTAPPQWGHCGELPHANSFQLLEEPTRGASADTDTQSEIITLIKILGIKRSLIKDPVKL